VLWRAQRLAAALLAAVVLVAAATTAAPALAAPQTVAGIEIDYPLRLERDGASEQRVAATARAGAGPPVRKVQVFHAPLAWDIGEGQGHLIVSRVDFAAPRDLDDAVREMGSFVAEHAGQVFKQEVVKFTVSDLDARLVVFVGELSGMRFGGDILVVGDARRTSIWQVQVLFARRPLSVDLDQDRQRALTVLYSVRILAALPGGGDAAAEGAQKSAAGCTLDESEDKTREVIYGIDRVKARNAAKAARVDRRFMQVFERYMSFSLDPDPARTEQRRHAFCRTLDALLAELER
jgi:hypothetical protein